MRGGKLKNNTEKIRGRGKKCRRRASKQASELQSLPVAIACCRLIFSPCNDLQICRSRLASTSHPHRPIGRQPATYLLVASQGNGQGKYRDSLLKYLATRSSRYRRDRNSLILRSINRTLHFASRPGGRSHLQVPGTGTSEINNGHPCRRASDPSDRCRSCHLVSCIPLHFMHHCIITIPRCSHLRRIMCIDRSRRFKILPAVFVQSNNSYHWGTFKSLW